MSLLERLSTLVGSLLIGVAAYVVVIERKAMAERQQRRSSVPVEELGNKLKEAWAGYHTR